MKARTTFLTMALSSALVASCSSTKETHEPPPPPALEVTPPPFGKPFDKLADWHLFVDDDGRTPADDLIPYDVNAPLFSDYAAKFRFVFVPKGQKIHYDADAAWDFPVGTALVKTFAMLSDLRDPSSKLRLLETRILYREPKGWSVNTYVYSDDQKEATRSIVGTVIDLTFKGEKGETVHDGYTVPNLTECVRCHGNGEATPLGLKTRQLERDLDYGGTVGVANQLDHLDELGLFDGALPGSSARAKLVDPYGKDALGERVRAYWDSNCGHCHSTGGYSGHSGLLLDYPSTDPKKSDANWGVCKSPTESGSQVCTDEYDVVPGDPAHSIMLCRVSSTEKGRMPSLGVQLLNQEGIDLIEQWIASLPKKTCN